MAITTYAQLQTAIASWLARSDLTSTIPDFITLCETTLNRNLRCREMMHTTTLTPSSGTATLPTDYVAWRRVTGSLGQPLEYAEPDWLYGAYPTAASGTAGYFTIEGESLIVRPSDDTALTFSYYKKIPALADATNWLLTKYPDVYLFGSLVEADVFIKDPDEALLFKQRLERALKEIEGVDFRSAGALSMRSNGPVV